MPVRLPGSPADLHRSQRLTQADGKRFRRQLERNELRAGGAKVLLEGEFDAQSLFDGIRELLSDGEKLGAMSEAMLALSVPDATDRICGIILETLH